MLTRDHITNEADFTFENFAAQTPAYWDRIFMSTFRVTEKRRKPEPSDPKRVYDGTLDIASLRAFLSYLDGHDSEAAQRLRRVAKDGATMDDQEFIKKCSGIFVHAVENKLLKIDRSETSLEPL